ncbi:hypothetical protein LPJ61_002364 [Coemansia biformis]|uniref:C2 domain-containing protein n=1 Tax=Coemansia biformis TaxID=1286918 RepID=A0A9W8CYR0_9FUNG|nr:hypothetical protein LPJ61_002364 [Coemansia biformis]
MPQLPASAQTQTPAGCQENCQLDSQSTPPGTPEHTRLSEPIGPEHTAGAPAPGPLASPVDTPRAQSLSPSLASLHLGDGLVDGGAIDWPYSLADARDSTTVPSYAVRAADTPTSAPNTAVAEQSEAATAPPPAAKSRTRSLQLHPSDTEQTTYQYALRYAMILDVDNALLAARSQSIINKCPEKSTPLTRMGSGSGFSVKAAGKASGTSNLNNRTPTLLFPGSGGSSSNGGGGGGGGRRLTVGATGQPVSRQRSRSWKSSLLGLGDSAARKIKAEIGSSGKRWGLTRGGDADAPAGSAKTGRLTPGIVKALTQQLKTASGAPSLHPLTQACYMELHNHLRVKESADALGEYGSVDDLLELFADLSHTVCSQHGIINNADIDRTVDSQTSRFIKLLRAVLQSKAYTSREAGLALLKLDDYPDTPAANGQPSPTPGDPAPRPSSYAASSPPAIDTPVTPPSQLATDWLRSVFGVPDSDHQQLVAELQGDVNQETAVQDLRTCLLVLKKDVGFAGKPENFRTPHAYRVWKDREITLLEQLIHSYSMRPSYMSGEQIGAGRLKLEASAIEAMDESEIADAFEYIPTNAATHYLTLMRKAVEHDIIGSLRPGTPDTVHSLSGPAKELLKQLAIAWRISASYRDTCYLDVINSYYELGDLPIAYVLDAFGKIERIVHLINPQDWHMAHYKYLLDTQNKIEYRALGAVQDVIEELDHQRPETHASLKRLLRNLIINDVNGPALLNKPMPNVEGRRDEVVGVLESSILYRCDCLSSQCFADETPAAPSLDGFAQLAVLVLCDYDRCSRIFADPLFEDGDRRFDIPGIVAELETEYFFASLRRHLDEFGYGMENTNIEIALELCKSITRVRELHARHSTRALEDVDDQRLFKAAASMWLRNIDEEKMNWAANAIKQDSAPRELGIGKHSTSVIDLISCFSQQATTMQRIQWPDVETKAWFLTEFMKYVDVCFEVYAQVMMRGFLECLSLPLQSGEGPTSPGWNSMWNSRRYKEHSIALSAATQAALSVLDESEPLRVTAEACVKLNNLAVARDKLYGLQDDLRVGETVEALGGDGRPSIRALAAETYLLSFKVIRAEGLELYKKHYDTSASKGTRPYVKLAVTRQAENEVTKRQTFARTREAPAGASNPRWNESFDLHVGSRDELMTPLEARVCTRDGPKHLGFREKTRARAFFALPSKLTAGIDSSVDVVLDMEPSGHLLLQATIDGEHEDVEFYSGRMFRVLSRTLSDMQQLIVEQVSVVIRDYLRQILVSPPIRYRASRIIGTTHMGIDRGIDRSIQFLKRGGHQAPATIRVTQESCCEALIPLIDYLENNLHTLFIHLYEETANGVIVKVWNEALVSLEDILLPPLRGSSKGTAKPLTESDLSNIYDCLDFLKWYFEGGVDKDGIPSEALEGRKYKELLEVRSMYFMMTRELMDEYMDEMRRSATRPAESTAEVGRPHGESPPSSNRHADSTGGTHPPGMADMSALPTPPPLPKRSPRRQTTHLPDAGGSDTSSFNAGRRFSGHVDGAENSSTDSLPLSPTQDLRAAIVPAEHTKSTLSRNRSVWAHKDANTLRRFRRSHRMVTDKGDLILRLLRLRFDKEAAKFAQTQLDLRTQQMQYEMRRAAKRRS